MNKIRFVRYARGKAIRIIESESGDVDSVRIGQGKMGGRYGVHTVTMSFYAPDGRETVVIISDPSTLKNLGERIASVQKQQADPGYIA